MRAIMTRRPDTPRSGAPARGYLRGMTTTAATEPSSDAPIALRAAISVEAIDHLVLTVRDLEATLRFYCGVLGMREERFGDDRVAVAFGSQKLNLHVAGAEVDPHAGAATPGSADVCLLTRTPVEGVLRVLGEHDVAVEVGPVERVGATGGLLSVYVRDPDGNLVELANQLDA
ncbi:MAG: putative ring-cleaving dioxygenase [Thermoleophilia bacterium]|nr:putative ring-cleaving dioxygenase [Thermoleophilia bacterium]